MKLLSFFKSNNRNQSNECLARQLPNVAFSWIKTPLIFLFVIIIGETTAAEQTPLEMVQQLDARYQHLSAKIYQARSTEQSSDILNAEKSAIELVYQQAQRLLAQGNQLSAITFIYSHIEIVRYELDNPIVFDLIELLLTHSQYTLAQSLFSQIEEGGERFFIANAALKFAKYHADRKEWQQTIELLNIDLEELTREDTNHARLLTGIAYQNIGEHRTAIKQYQLIAANSSFYPYAQLNNAVAHIRQDWWTDAHIIINQLLKSSPKTKESELGNRLFLMLGYSLLNKGYYRESREAFRSIQLDSRYANKALLGISLVAVSQEDSSGALNALSILKEKDIKHLEVDESHLLIPHIYKKLEQYGTANAGYTDAIAYYQKRVNQLSHPLRVQNIYTFGELAMNSHTEFKVANTPFIFTDIFPHYFLKNFEELNRLNNMVKEPKLKRSTEILFREYQTMFNLMVKSLIEIRIEAIASYLNQSQYSIAQLYDKNSK